MSLVARHLEENGIPTVIIGSALDIVEYCGVPRFVFSDFPLGNPCGLPGSGDMQKEIVKLGVGLLESAETSRTIVRAPFDWHDSDAWRARYNRVDPADRERLLALGDSRRASRGQAPRQA